MDGLGFRPALQEVARRVAKTGYYAMLPDLYYRAGPAAAVKPGEPGEWDRMMALVRSLADDMVIGLLGSVGLRGP